MLNSAGAAANYTPHRTSATQDLQVLAGAQEYWSCGRLFPTPHICHRGPAGPGRSSAAFSSAAAVADSSPHRKSAIQDLQVLTGAQQCWIYGRLFSTLHICHPGPAGPDRSSAALSSAGAVANYTPHRTSATQDLQVLAGAQEHWSCGRLFPTPRICHPGPADPGRSSAASSSTGAVADSSPHRTSAIQDLQVLTGAQQRSAVLELWQIVHHTPNLPSRTCRSGQELSSAQQC